MGVASHVADVFKVYHCTASQEWQRQYGKDNQRLIQERVAIYAKSALNTGLCNGEVEIIAELIAP